MMSTKLLSVCQKLNQYLSKADYCCKIPVPVKPVVTILNANSMIGKHLGLLLKQSPFIEELRLYDTHGEVYNVAEDLSHIDTKTKVRSFCGSDVIKQAIEESDVMIQVGGCQTKTGVTDNDLFEENVDTVRNAALYAAEFNPKGIFCIQTPPIECMVPMVSEEYKRAGTYDPRKIIGITNIASMRANYFIGKETNHDPTHVLTPIVGGHGHRSTIAVISQSKPKVEFTPSQTALLQKTIANAEIEALKIFKTPTSLCLSQAVGVSRFINNMVKAVLGETSCVECAFVRQTGHIEHFLPYMTSIVRLGRHGILSTHMPKISSEEAYHLKKATIFIRTNIRLGEALISGSVTKEPSPKFREEVVPCNAIDTSEMDGTQEIPPPQNRKRNSCSVQTEVKKT